MGRKGEEVVFMPSYLLLKMALGIEHIARYQNIEFES